MLLLFENDNPHSPTHSKDPDITGWRPSYDKTKAASSEKVVETFDYRRSLQHMSQHTEKNSLPEAKYGTE